MLLAKADETGAVGDWVEAEFRPANGPATMAVPSKATAIATATAAPAMRGVILRFVTSPS